MSPEQFKLLLDTLRELSSRPYTITGAADWGMFMALLSLIGALIMLNIGLVVYSWHDLKGSVAKSITEHEAELDKKCAENAQALRDLENRQTKAVDTIWEAMKTCQDDCCPRRKA